jgi:hypothetical protein
MKNSSLILLLLSALISFDSFAQTNFVKGYYVTFSLDTVHGLLEYRTEERNTKYCAYKVSPNSPAIKYSPDEVFSYVLEDKVIYRGYSVQKIEGAENVFLEVLVKGSLSFLKSYGSTYFLETKEGKLIDLPVPDKKLVTIDYKTYLSKVRYTKGVLRSLVQEYPDLLYQVDNSPLTVQLVKNLVTGYNQLQDHKLRFVKKAPIQIKAHVSFGPVASFKSSGFVLNTKEVGSLSSNFSRSLAAGAFAQLFIPKIDETIKLNYYLLYGKNNFYFSHSTIYNNNDIFINYSELSNALTVQKSFLRFLGILVEGGIQHTYAFSRTNRWRQEQLLTNSIQTEYLQTKELASPAYLGLLFGFGKSFSFGQNLYAVPTIRYSLLNGINNDFYSSTIQTTEFQVKLMFR